MTDMDNISLKDIKKNRVNALKYQSKPVQAPPKPYVYSNPKPNIRPEAREEMKNPSFMERWRNRNQNDSMTTSTKSESKSSSSAMRVQNNYDTALLSKEAQKILNNGKHVIIGATWCGHCQNETKIIKNQYRTAKLVNDGKKVVLDRSEWEDYRKSLKTSQDTLTKLDTMYKNNQVKKSDYYALKSQIEHLIDTNQILLNPDINYDKITSDFEIRYTDDITKEEEKQMKSMLNEFKQKKMNRDQIYKELDKRKASRIKQYLLTTELASVFKVNSFPTEVLDKCKIDKQTKDLSTCKQSGFMEPLSLIQFHANQRGDTELLQKLSDLQQKKVQKSKANIPDIMEFSTELSKIALGDD